MNKGTLIAAAVVLGVMIILLFAFQFLSEYKKRRKIKKEKEKLKNLKNQTILEVSARINAITEYNEELLRNFVVSVGDKKMGEINLISKKRLEAITKTDAFKTVFEENLINEKVELSDHLKKLIATKSNLWNKKTKEEILYFKGFEEVYLKDENKKEEYLNIKEEYLKNIEDEIK